MAMSSGVTQAYVDGEVGSPFKAVLGKDVVGGLQNLVVAGAELIGEGICFVRQEVPQCSEGKAANVFGNIVVVGAPDFSPQREGMGAFQPAKGVVQDASRVTPPSWFPSRPSA